MTLKESIEKAQSFASWLHPKINDRNVSVDLRMKLGMSILQQSLDVNDGIIFLLKENLPGAALALARPLFESYVRGIWLFYFASESDINGFLEGNSPKLSNLIKAIGSYADTGGAWIHDMGNQLSSFHDLTHGGVEHFKRRVTNGGIEPNYPENELINLVKLGVELRIRVGAELLSIFRDDDGLEALSKQAAAIRQES